MFTEKLNGSISSFKAFGKYNDYWKTLNRNFSNKIYECTRIVWVVLQREFGLNSNQNS